MGKAAEKEEVRGAKLSFAQLMLDLDEQWPSLKFLGFGAYYAWIFLCYNSGVLFNWSDTVTGSEAMLAMYLASTTALGSVLILAGIFHKQAARAIDSHLCVFVMALVATVATFVLSWATLFGSETPLYMAGCVLTGVGTAFVALRLGTIYSSVGARQAFMYTAGSLVFAGMLYFVCIGVPQPAGLILTASLPLLAAVCTMVVAHKSKNDNSEVVSIRELPRGFFPRFIVAIAAFSVMTGVVKGFTALSQPVSALTGQGVIIVFATTCSAAVLFLLVGLIVRDFDISRLYYPIIILACLGVLAVPMLGGIGVVQGEFVSIAYNLFIMMVWCLLANVANRTDLSAIRVYGLGRGASAIGTTIGWFTGSALAPMLVENSNSMVALAMGMVFVMLVVSMILLNERTIGQALKKTHNIESDVTTGYFFPNRMVPDRPAEGSDAFPKEGAWTKSCNVLADESKLSTRERDVLFLLAKGRSLDYIATELGISFNTAKSHSRNVYTKLDVHSKQELLNLIERKKV